MYNLRSRRSVLGLLLLTVVSYFLFQWYVIPGLSEIWALEPVNTTQDDLDLIMVPFVGYLIISGFACLTVDIFKPLKIWSEKGLSWHLGLCFLMGLVWGLFGLIILGIPLGPEWGIIGLIRGLTVGLIMCLIAGLTGGLRREFFD
jgi:hypothetical protein